MSKWSVLALAALLLAPAVSAEFGEEREGYPVNVDGDVVYPYIPKDLAERHEDLVEDLLAGDPLNKINGYTAFPYYPLLTAEVRRLAEDHPGLVRLTSAGQSHLGLELHLLEIADFHNPNRMPLAEREVIYLDGGTHSNEYSGVYFVTEWLQFLLDEYETNETAKWIVENRHTFVMPMINPDGSHVFGRVNAIDVNINRNFPGTWGTVDETPVLNWPGPYPASEPETQAVIKVMQETRPDFVQSTHCCGNLWLHPYGAEQLGHAADFDMLTEICVRVFSDLPTACGEIWSTIYPASGTTADEGYAQVGASSWTYEMSGRGAIAPWGQPVVDTDVRVQEIESWRGVMHGMLHAEKYGALPVITSIVGDADGLKVTVQNQGWGNITQASLRIGDHGVSIPALVPGQEAIFELEGDFQTGGIPVDLEWKKRMHPDSNWGRKLMDIQLVTGEAGELLGLLPELPKAPSMASLLPELPDGVLENMTTPPALTEPVMESGEDKGAPGVALLPLLAAVGLAFLARRR